MSRQQASEEQIYQELDQVRVHDHVALVCRSIDEMTKVIVLYLKKGLELGQRCLYVGPEGNIGTVIKALQEHGIDTAAAIARGALVTSGTLGLPADDLFDPVGFIAAIRQAADDAQAAGFPALRLCDEKTWIFRTRYTTDLLAEFESMMNELADSSPVVVTCIYDLMQFPPGIIRDVLRTHPRIMICGRICHNALYLPTDQMFRSDLEAVEVERLLEEILRTQEMLMRKTLFEKVFENIPDAIFAKDLQGRYLLMNETAARYFGTTPDQMIGRTVDELQPPEEAEHIRKTDQRVFAGEGPITAEVAVTDGGTTRVFKAIKGPFRSEDGKLSGLFGIAHDITEEKRLQRELIDYREQLRYLASEISLMEERQRREIASVLHDQVGQTLALAKIRLHTLKKRLQPLACFHEVEAEMSAVLELMDSAISHSRSLTEQVSPPLLYTVGLEAAVEALGEEFQKRHGLRIAFHDDQARKPLSDDLRGLLYQSVRELLVNIVKHAGASDAAISICRDGSFISITVSDNGIGFTGDGDHVQAGSDVGFGLFRIRERLKYAGGCFNIDTAPGEGTVVTLLAPISQSAG